MPDIPVGDPFDAALDFVAEWETYAEGVDDNGQYFVRQGYYGPWGNAREFMFRMLGASYSTSGWSRQIPYQLPGNTKLYAREATITNMKGISIDLSDPSIAKDTHARVTVTYRVPILNFGRDDNSDENSLGATEDELNALLWAEQEIDSFVDVITIPGSNCFWWESVKPVATPSRLFVVCMTMDIFYHQYPFLPANIAAYYLGKLNNSTFLGCARGTVMCKKAKTRRTVDSNGRKTQQFGISFHFREYDWNKEPLVKKMNGDTFAYAGQWDYIVTKPTLLDPAVDDVGPWRYQYANFQDLLEFQLP